MSNQSIFEPYAVHGMGIYDQLLHKLQGIAKRCRHVAEHSLEPEAVPTLRRMADDMDAAIPPLEERIQAFFGDQLDWPNARLAGVTPRRIH